MCLTKLVFGLIKQWKGTQWYHVHLLKANKFVIVLIMIHLMKYLGASGPGNVMASTELMITRR